MMANNAHWQSPDELRLESELDEIACLNVLENLLIAYLRLDGCGKTDAGFAHPFADNLFQAAKSAAYHK